MRKNIYGKPKKSKHIPLSPIFANVQCAVVFEPLAEGGYNVIVPSIPEICTFGQTLREAEHMVKDAIRCYIESEWKLVTTRTRRAAVSA